MGGMDEARIVLRLNLVIALLCVLVVHTSIPYLLFVYDHFPNFLYAVIAALATMGGLFLFRTYRAVRS
jgi:hypothetical protein